jgi:hypothetical protein
MRPVPLANRSFGGGGTMKVARTFWVYHQPMSLTSRPRTFALTTGATARGSLASVSVSAACTKDWNKFEQWRIHLRGMFNSPEVYRVEGRKASVCFKLNFQLGSYYQRKQSVRNWNHDVSSMNAVRKQVRVRVRVQACASTVYTYRFPIMSPSTQAIVRSSLGYSTWIVSLTSVRGAPLVSE